MTPFHNVIQNFSCVIPAWKIFIPIKIPARTLESAVTMATRGSLPQRSEFRHTTLKIQTRFVNIVTPDWCVRSDEQLDLADWTFFTKVCRRCTHHKRLCADYVSFKETCDLIGPAETTAFGHTNLLRHTQVHFNLSVSSLLQIQNVVFFGWTRQY